MGLTARDFGACLLGLRAEGSSPRGFMVWGLGLGVFGTIRISRLVSSKHSLNPIPGTETAVSEISTS